MSQSGSNLKESGTSQKKKLRLLKNKTYSLADDIEFKDLDINPLIKDYMIREAFDMFDEDHSGEIDKREFSKLIMSLGLELNEKRINELMKEMDKDGSGTIDFDEFREMMSNFQFGKESPIQQHLESAFNDYDKDMDSFITAEDFKKVSEELDTITVSKEEANMFISFCKHFGKEKGIQSLREDAVSKEEFINALISVNFLIEGKSQGKSTGASMIGGHNPGTSMTNTNLNQSQAVDSNLNPSEGKTLSFLNKPNIESHKSKSSKDESSFY